MANSGHFLSTFLFVLAILMLNVALGAKFAQINDISCSTVTQQLSSCLSFITHQVDKPSSECCTGANKLSGMVKTKADRQAVCTCVKNTLSKLSNVDYNRINQIPDACGVKVTLPVITKDTDCKSISLKDLMIA